MNLKTTARTEPVATAAGTAVSATVVVAAGLALLRAFGVPIDDTQHTAIVGFVGVVAPLAAALWARARVTPVPPQHRRE
ncbi:hypothetical protein [Nocardioides zeae]|uniref:Membrane protein DedA with SNARE-associated domain n=1 Tax=Nocardioides zeae TaxID=1457234 RepID=A0AAJ1U445_9ACTN|nr:hypothetical protein [Nocardioides zeae]MDQ1103892.1 membrane protein DedA with SNARE-associated domain [Nocardioides zeae]